MPKLDNLAKSGRTVYRLHLLLRFETFLQKDFPNFLSRPDLSSAQIRFKEGEHSQSSANGSAEQKVAQIYQRW